MFKICRNATAVQQPSPEEKSKVMRQKKGGQQKKVSVTHAEQIPEKKNIQKKSDVSRNSKFDIDLTYLIASVDV